MSARAERDSFNQTRERYLERVANSAVTVTTTGGSNVLLTIAIIIIILWALGFLAFHVASPLIHLLLVIGVIVLIVHFVRGRPAV